MKRSSGILLHLTSLPSPYGVGNMGQAARDFVDFLHEAKQRYWQLLPISPTGYGDSPYQSSSAFAGNPYLLDPDQFVAEGLLTQEDLEGCWGENPEMTDYGVLYEKRLPSMPLGTPVLTIRPTIFRSIRRRKSPVIGASVRRRSRSRIGRI